MQNRWKVFFHLKVLESISRWQLTWSSFPRDQQAQCVRVCTDGSEHVSIQTSSPLPDVHPRSLSSSSPSSWAVSPMCLTCSGPGAGNSAYKGSSHQATTQLTLVISASKESGVCLGSSYEVTPANGFYLTPASVLLVILSLVPCLLPWILSISLASKEMDLRNF